MTTSLSNHGPSARPVDGFEEDPYGKDNPYEARLRGLSPQQLTDRLTWESGSVAGTSLVVRVCDVDEYLLVTLRFY